MNSQALIFIDNYLCNLRWLNVETALLTDVTTLQNETCRMTIADAMKTSEVTRLGKRKLLRKRTS